MLSLKNKNMDIKLDSVIVAHEGVGKCLLRIELYTNTSAVIYVTCPHPINRAAVNTSAVNYVTFPHPINRAAVSEVAEF